MKPSPKVEIKEDTLLSDNWYILKRYTYDIQYPGKQKESQRREVYDRGNGSTILLYNQDQRTVVLTRQFRLPSFINGNEDGMLIEACAGLLDNDNPEDCIRKETQEETGYLISDVEKIFEVYMSPGSVTEILHFFIGAYTPDMKIGDGGGLAHEQENIEVLELDFDEAYGMIASGDIKDAKTVMLLQYVKLKGIL